MRFAVHNARTDKTGVMEVPLPFLHPSRSQLRLDGVSHDSRNSCYRYPLIKSNTYPVSASGIVALANYPEYDLQNARYSNLRHTCTDCKSRER